MVWLARKLLMRKRSVWIVSIEVVEDFGLGNFKASLPPRTFYLERLQALRIVEVKG
jgi:hypothetical protein